MPKIASVFEDSVSELSNSKFYLEVINNTLRKILPSATFNGLNESAWIDRFRDLLPHTYVTPYKEGIRYISFFVLSHYRPNAFKFFFEMVSQWLTPGKRLNVVTIYAGDFRFPTFNDDIYTLSEVMIHVDNPADLLSIQENFSIIESEIRLGMESSYYARRIIEIRGLSLDDKTAMIHETIVYLVRRQHVHFDQDVLTEMQHFLVMCSDEFKAMRECRHLSRIISCHYLFRKSLRASVKAIPGKRHVIVKFFRSRIRHQNAYKNVLGIVVGMNFLREKEIFEKKQLLSALQNYIPGLLSVEGSFFVNRHASEHVSILYLEVEKAEGAPFTSEEIRLLRRDLAFDLKDRVELPVHPVFMPRNEEEIMRNILALSSQIRFLRDIPQVIINFDEQTHSHLFFNIILARVMMPETLSVQHLFDQTPTIVEYIHDRSKMVGYLRKKYTKEANVFRLKLLKEPFLRRDHSIDLYKARQTVLQELTRAVGEVRDFNGGMISKQHELLNTVKERLDDCAKYSEHLLDNFFFSLTPAVMQTLLEPEALKRLFLMVLEAMTHECEGVSVYHKIYVEPDFVFVVIKGGKKIFTQDIYRCLQQFPHHALELAHSAIYVHELPYLGYIFRCNEPLKQVKFCQAIENVIARMVLSKV